MTDMTEEEYSNGMEQLQQIQDRLESADNVIKLQYRRLNKFYEATFWQRIKYAFTGDAGKLGGK